MYDQIGLRPLHTIILCSYTHSPAICNSPAVFGTASLQDQLLVLVVPQQPLDSSLFSIGRCRVTVGQFVGDIFYKGEMSLSSVVDAGDREASSSEPG